MILKKARKKNQIYPYKWCGCCKYYNVPGEQDKKEVGLTKGGAVSEKSNLLRLLFVLLFMH